MKCTEYRLDSRPLPLQVAYCMRQQRVSPEDRDAVWCMLAPLGTKRAAGVFHRDHSLRVGLLSCEIGACLGVDPKALLFAGLLHDVGKAQVPLCTLCATETWTATDQSNIEQHVLDGFRMLRDRFDFTAHVIARHHRFQARGYPVELPTHSYSAATEAKIARCSELLAIADAFDAKHRINSGTGGRALSAAQIRDELLTKHPGADVPALYASGVLH